MSSAGDSDRRAAARWSGSSSRDEGGDGTGAGSSLGRMCEEQAGVGLEDAAEREELGERLAEVGGADAAGVAELAASHGLAGGAEDLLDALFWRRTVRSRRRSRERRVGGGGDAQGERGAMLVKLEGSAEMEEAARCSTARDRLSLERRR